MSSFDFTQITAGGAFASAMQAARESDRRDAERSPAPRGRDQSLPSLGCLLRRLTAGLTRRRRAAFP